MSYQKRQHLRRLSLLISMLLFPALFYYFSPYLIVESASQGIINGSFVIFGWLFLSAMLFGRMWCGWLCPAGGLQEFLRPLNNQSPPPAAKRIKWYLWFLWLGVIATAYWSAGGFQKLDFFYQTQSGLSAVSLPSYITYYVVIALFMTLSLTLGRRGACHSLCWMAPFMIVGRKASQEIGLPVLHLETEPQRCTHCQGCSRSCPMGLDVHQMVQEQTMTPPECVLCGSCVDQCDSHVIQYRFSPLKNAANQKATSQNK